MSFEAAFTDAVLKRMYALLYKHEGKRAFHDGYMHFAPYFCAVMKDIRDVTPKDKLKRDVDIRVWKRRVRASSALIGSDPHLAGLDAEEPSDELVARMLYARYVKPSCENEPYIHMREYRPKNGDAAFCRANAQTFGRTCDNMLRWKPVPTMPGSDGDGGGGGGIGYPSKEDLDDLDDFLNEPEDAYASAFPDAPLHVPMPVLPSVPTHAPSVAERVAIVLPRGGRRQQQRRVSAAASTPVSHMTVTIEDGYIDADRRMRDVYKCSHGGAPPPLRFDNVPENTVSMAVQMYDTTARFTHWLAWNVGTANERVGVNSYNLCDYSAPCPPVHGGRHEYVITAYALSRVPTALQNSKTPVTKAVFDKSVEKAALATAQTVLYYNRDE